MNLYCKRCGRVLHQAPNDNNRTCDICNFNPMELVARVKAHLARYQRLVSDSVKTNEFIEAGEIKIDKTARRVYINGEEKIFTTKEFDLLTFLAENPNRVFKKEELFNQNSARSLSGNCF